MRYEYDPGANAVYICLRELPFAYNKELDDSRIIDYAVDNKPIGVELLNVSLGVELGGLPEPNAVGQLLRKHGIAILEQAEPVQES